MSDFSLTPEAVVRRCSVKEVFFRKIRRKTPVPESLFNRVAGGLMSATILKKKLWRRCFPMNFAKVLRTPPVAASVTRMTKPSHMS